MIADPLPLTGFELLAFGLLEIRNPGVFGRPAVAGSSATTGNASSSTSITISSNFKLCVV
jgi:hypothetical protein